MFRDKGFWNLAGAIFDYCTSSMMAMSLIFWIWVIAVVVMLVREMF